MTSIPNVGEMRSKNDSPDTSLVESRLVLECDAVQYDFSGVDPWRQRECQISALRP